MIDMQYDVMMTCKTFSSHTCTRACTHNNPPDNLFFPHPLPSLPHTHTHREFAKSIPRPFSLRYNAYTQSMEVISDSGSIQKLVDDIKYDVDTLQDALRKASKTS